MEETGRGFEHFEHGADVGVRGFGPTLDTAFAEAARALTAVVADPATVEPRERVTIACEAPAADVLLVDFLNALLYEMATRRMLFSRFDVAIHGGRLTAQAAGEPFDPDRHEATVEVKGATFTALKVGRAEDGRYVAQCVVDV